MGTDLSKRKMQYRTRQQGDFPANRNLRLVKDIDFKYGENPNQQAACYVLDTLRTAANQTTIDYVRDDQKGKGGLSLTNMMDITRAMDVLKFFDNPAWVIMKHAIVSGFATRAGADRSSDELFRLARNADLRSNFGGTLVSNEALDRDTAEAMYERDGFFVDVVAMPAYEEGVVGYLQKASKNIRIAEVSGLGRLPRFVGDETFGLQSFKELPGGRLAVQDVYLTGIRSVEDLVMHPMVVDKKGLEHEVRRACTPREAQDVLTAWYLNIAGARSNGIVLVKDGVSVAMGSGQVERVGAVEQAIVKGVHKAMDREGIPYDPLMGIAQMDKLEYNPLDGAVCSSDAFFPFRDSIDTLARIGVAAVVQPFGSMRDAMVIDAANEHGLAMPAADYRCFGHW